jgi:hypothetical protein
VTGPLLRPVLRAGVVEKPGQKEEDVTDDAIIINAITANLEAMESLLYEANVRASEAVASARQGERNMAIGAVIGIESLLTDVHALYGAAISLQRIALRGKG